MEEYIKNFLEPLVRMSKLNACGITGLNHPQIIQIKRIEPLREDNI
jgi:hypothetical protein